VKFPKVAAEAYSHSHRSTSRQAARADLTTLPYIGNTTRPGMDVGIKSWGKVDILLTVARKK